MDHTSLFGLSSRSLANLSMVIDHRCHVNGPADAGGFSLHLALAIPNVGWLGRFSVLLEKVVVVASASDVTTKVPVGLLASSIASFLRSLGRFDVEALKVVARSCFHNKIPIGRRQEISHIHLNLALHVVCVSVPVLFY